MIEPLLELAGVEAFYAQSQALFGITMSVDRGTAVALMGRNGMGKTTTIHTILGLARVRAGTIHFDGRAITGNRPHDIARRGIGLVPEGRQVFPTLTVRENLIATSANYSDSSEPWTVSRVYELFPRLKERERSLGATLSGGEQQMLAIGRALMLNPRMIVLDEATEGLAPLVRADIRAALARLKEGGLTILIVDKSLSELATFVDAVYVIEKGRAVWQGTPEALLADDASRARLLGV